MKKLPMSLKVAFTYTMLSLLWLSFSDRIIYRIADSTFSLSRLQSYKGYLFIMLSASLIFFILKNMEIRHQNTVTNLRHKNLVLRQDNEVLTMKLDTRLYWSSEVEQYGSYDDLTGLPNRRKGLEALKNQLGISRENKTNLLAALIDIDSLNMVNENYGYQEGDILISTAARILNNIIEDKDMLCRLGEDEFLLVCPESGADDISTIKQKIDTALQTYNLYSNKSYPVSCSVGFAEYNSSINPEIKDLIDMASRKLHEEKRIGKLNFLHRNELMYG
jgi:diguanylate cyclase (GGDEF)-like protein